MCIAADDSSGAGGMDWAEAHPRWSGLDPSLIAAPVPNGPIAVDVDPADLGGLPERWNLYGAGSYLPR